MIPTIIKPVAELFEPDTLLANYEVGIGIDMIKLVDAILLPIVEVRGCVVHFMSGDVSSTRCA